MVDTADDELTEQLLDGVLEAPIEDWMAFLDPAQAKLVRCSCNGPARIRGAAGTGTGTGTGKTVVGLHRASRWTQAPAGYRSRCSRTAVRGTSRTTSDCNRARGEWAMPLKRDRRAHRTPPRSPLSCPDRQTQPA
jgi:hypothetical protein